MHRVRESSAANSAVAHISSPMHRNRVLGVIWRVSAAEEKGQGDLTAVFQYLKGGTREKGRKFLQGRIGIGQKAVNLN